MAGSSLLTQGLEPLASHSSVIRAKLAELYALDEKLQAAHQQAKRDDDFGEEVVTKYTTFLACRQQLIAELERQQMQVPWQLRMTIDDLETTLKQRQEKKEGKAKSAKKATEAKKQQESTAAKTQKQEEEAGTATPAAESGRVAIAFVGPTLVALLIALLWYQYKSSSE